MKTVLAIFVLLLGAIAMANENVKILIITGGHDFEREPFFKMFSDMKNVVFDTVSHPSANALYSSSKMDDVDVLVFYDMYQDISEQQQADFVDLAKRGKGFLFLHHSLVSYQAWDDYKQILGGRYNLEPEDKSKTSSFKHGLDMHITIADSTHPVVSGLKDFVIHDEAYGNFEVLPGVHPLLKTNHPESGEIIGWTNEYGKSRIVYLQLGHDHFAYENENYSTLVRNALMWLANNEN